MSNANKKLEAWKKQQAINANAAVINEMINQLTFPPAVVFGTLYAEATTEMPNKQPQKEEGNMYDKEYQQKQYLDNRLRDVFDTKEEKLRDVYHLEWTDFPKTPAEVKARLAAGQYTLDFRGKKDDAEFDATWLPSFFSWRTVDADTYGYEKALEDLRKQATAVKDQAFLGYAEGLKALQDFEATA